MTVRDNKPKPLSIQIRNDALELSILTGHYAEGVAQYAEDDLTVAATLRGSLSKSLCESAVTLLPAIAGMQVYERQNPLVDVELQQKCDDAAQLLERVVTHLVQAEVGRVEASSRDQLLRDIQAWLTEDDGQRKEGDFDASDQDAPG